ncbi:MAG: dihydrofolate reductase family protein [Acidimicrobiia bacterium]|nr:dihydrofolate reductase family protein [Acidimicrobiia bacterium]
MDIEELYADVARPAPPNRPWLALNMVASMDGATSLAGRSGGLGSPEDRSIFHVLRGAADAVMVGAGTARVEEYGPVRVTGDIREARTRRGQLPTPRLVILTRSVGLDPSSPMFTDADPSSPTTVVAPADADADRLAAVARVGEVVTAGTGGADVPAALGELRSRGVEFVLCEGGPSLNADLATLGCVDEVNLTLAPLALGGTAKRIFAHADLVQPLEFELAHSFAAANHVFLRYVRRG